MALVPIFTGQVDAHGQLHLNDRERVQRKQWLQSLSAQDVEIVVRKRRTQRSLDQNKYVHAVPFPIFAEYFGEDIETTKLLLLGERFGWRETRSGVRVPMKPSTSALSTEEMSQLIEWMPPWGLTNFGLDIPLPMKAEAA